MKQLPMALEEADGRLFIATRAPPRLAVFDANSGHLVAALPDVPPRADHGAEVWTYTVQEAQRITSFDSVP